MLGLQQHIKYTTSLASQAMYQVRGDIYYRNKRLACNVPGNDNHYGEYKARQGDRG